MDDTILCTPIGIYKQHTDSAGILYYARRVHTINNPALSGNLRLQRQEQVLIVAFGEMTWINI